MSIQFRENSVAQKDLRKLTKNLPTFISRVPREFRSLNYASNLLDAFLLRAISKRFLHYLLRCVDKFSIVSTRFVDFFFFAISVSLSGFVWVALRIIKSLPQRVSNLNFIFHFKNLKNECRIEDAFVFWSENTFVQLTWAEGVVNFSHFLLLQNH